MEKLVSLSVKSASRSQAQQDQGCRFRDGCALSFPLLFGQVFPENKLMDFCPVSSFRSEPGGDLVSGHLWVLPYSPEMHLGGGPSSHALVATFGLVERKVPLQPSPGFRSIGVIPQIDLLVFHAPLQPLDEDVIQRATPAIHADAHPGPFHTHDELLTGELRPLIGVANLWAPTGQGPSQRLDTKAGVQGVAQFPGHDVATEPVHDRHQVQAPPPHRYIRDVRAPPLVGSDHLECPQ